MKDKGIKPCIPDHKSRGKPVKYDKRRYKRRNRLEIMFAPLQDWRRVATRYDRCSKVFLSGTSKDAADKLVRGIKRKTRKHYSAEEKIRVVLEGLRGEESIADPDVARGSLRAFTIRGRRSSSRSASPGLQAIRHNRQQPRGRGTAFRVGSPERGKPHFVKACPRV